MSRDRREYMREYMRQARQKDPDKVRGWERAWRRANPNFRALANPENALLRQAKSCIAVSFGIRWAAVPLELAEAKAAHLRAVRQVRESVNNEKERGTNEPA